MAIKGESDLVCNSNYQTYKVSSLLKNQNPHEDCYKLLLVTESSWRSFSKHIVFLSAPSRAPDIVIAQAVNSTSLVIKWSYLPEEHFRGLPTGYYIIYFPAYSKNDTNFVNVNFASNSTILSNLTTYTIYIINVSAVSLGGKGPANTARAQTQAKGNIYAEIVGLHLSSIASSNTSITRKEALPYSKYLGCSGHAFPCYDLKILKGTGKHPLLPSLVCSYLSNVCGGGEFETLSRVEE